jgi:DNA polymerase elongation subunit (family B)
MKLTFIPLDFDYFDYQGKNYAKIIGRNDKGKKVCIIDSCDTYFWVILKKNVSEKKAKEICKKIEKLHVESSSRITRVLKTELKDKNFLGQPVKAIKVFISNYKDAHDIADQIGYKEVDKRREYDLNFITKYIIEKNIKPLTWYEVSGEICNEHDFNGIPSSLDVDLVLKVDNIKLSTSQNLFKPKVLAFDIEADEFEIGKGQVLMISLVGDNFQKVLTWKGKTSNKPNFVETFKDETEMLKAFVKYVKDFDPDLLAGYFSDGFDLPYLRARAEKNKIKLNLGIDNSQPVFSRGRLLTSKIKGIIHIDLFRFIRVVYSPYLQSETLTLNEVSSELLGEKKVEWKHKHSSKLKSDEWEKYFEYNLQDSVLAFKLAEKLWFDMLEFSRIVQEPLFDVCRDSMSNHVENYIIHNLNKFDEITEKRPVHDEIGARRSAERYEGAFVLQPTPGLYENIVFFDFTSMYTTVIVTYNLSRSTFLEKKQKDSLEVNLEKSKAFFSKKPGFFPLMLKEIFDKRKEFKQEYNKKKDNLSKARSNALKLLANASYGYQGFFGARYYCLPAAAATAALARKLIKETIQFIEKQGFKVTYADTDSVIFLQENKTKKEVLELLKKINNKLPGIIELDLEGFFKRGIWVTKRSGDFGAKKKYALLDNNEKIKIRGFETVRRDWCDLARETQNKVLELILKNGNEKKALAFVKEIIKKIKNREVPLEKLIIKTQLKKSIEDYKAISPHVTIAKKMREQGLPINIGMLIEFFISESKNKKALVRERAKLPDEPGKYDITYYIKNQILPAIENILEVFNININELIDGKKQMSLKDF